MEVQFTKIFSKQIDEIRDKTLLSKLSSVVKAIMAAETSKNISNIKKLKGHSDAFRIKIGDYRVGLFIENNEVTFAYFSHRKDIYNRFP